MPQRSSSPRARRASVTLALAAAAASALSSCNDNPSCVFAGGCQGGGGGPLGQAASLPDDGHLILSAPPTIEGAFPEGADVSSRTPIAIVFSESMAPSAVEGQIEVLALDIGGFPLAPVPTSQTLAGEGRMLLVLPLAPLQPGDYVVRVASDGVLLDLTGQKVAVDPDEQLVAFQVDLEDPDEVAVVATLPLGGADADPQPTTTSIVVVLDRPVDPASVTQASFDVAVDGAPPAFDPLPAPLVVPSAVLPVVDPRVFTWRSVDMAGVPASLGVGAEVVLTLSPDAAPIVDPEGAAVSELVLEFETQSIEPPLTVDLMSMPPDAIGIANLTPGDPEELALQVGLDAGEPGDELLVTLFGDSKTDDPQLVAIAHEVEVDGLPPITAMPVGLDDLDLIEDPGVATFGDGTLAIAVALRRGNQVSPVRLLDVDDVAPGIQDALLDTVAPELEQLLVPGGSLTELRSDVRDLVVAGLATEPLRAAEVVTPLGDNLLKPGVLGTIEDGLFLASKVPLGQIAGGGPVDFELVLRDPALNSSATVLGVFTQHGAVEGGAAFVPGAPIEVEVVDRDTLLPIAGARVYAHRDDGAAHPVVDAQPTSADGTASVLSADLGDPTILTVDADGYDLVSFHDLRATRISVVLRPSGAPVPSAVGGVVTGKSDFAKLGLGLMQKRFDDSRRPDALLPSFEGGACAGSPPACPFGPEPIRPLELGAVSMVAGNFLLPEENFSAAQLLQAFELALPRPRVAAAANDTVQLEVAFLLTEPTAPPAEAPSETPAAMLDLNPSGMLADLVGPPSFTVETVVPGLRAPVMVGLGIPYAGAPGVYTLRGAIPGAVLGGEFVETGAVDPDVFLRVEARDTLGNRSAARPRASAVATLPTPGLLEPIAPPQVVTPASGASAGGAAYDVVVENALADAHTQPGIYVVTLEDAFGRRWTLYRPDPPDAAGATTRVRVSDLAAVVGLPGAGLADGPVEAFARVLAWPGFDAGAFLFTDLDREPQIDAQGAAIAFTQP